MPACQRVNHWSCLWCLIWSRTHQPAANVVFCLMRFLSFSLLGLCMWMQGFFLPHDACSCHTLYFDSFRSYLVGRVEQDRSAEERLLRNGKCKKGYYRPYKGPLSFSPVLSLTLKKPPSANNLPDGKGDLQLIPSYGSFSCWRRGEMQMGVAVCRGTWSFCFI